MRVRIASALLAVLVLAPACWANPTLKNCAAEPVTTDIAFGDLVQCEINPIGDTDLFRFTAQAGDIITVAAIYRSGGDPCFRLIDPDATIGGYVCANALRSVATDYKLTKSGSYSIQVADGGNNQIMAYSL